MAWRKTLGRGLRWLGARLQSKEAASRADWEKRMAPFVVRYAPAESAERYPTLLLLHGCAGDFPHLEHWARLLAAEGYLVYTIDSLTPRNIRPWRASRLVCLGLRLQGLERSRDITAALSAIRRDAAADLNRLGLIGWSHGAWTAMEWLHRPMQMQSLSDAGARLAALIFVYPYCGLASVIHQRDWPATAPILFVTAERDRTVANGPTRRLARDLRKRGLPARLVTMRGAQHAFDLFDKNGFDPARARDLQTTVLRFLKQELRL